MLQHRSSWYVSSEKANGSAWLTSPFAVALLVWDHIITFGAEVRKVWSQKIGGGSVLYLLLRYGTLFEKITVMFLASWYMTPHVRDKLPFLVYRLYLTPSSGVRNSTH